MKKNSVIVIAITQNKEYIITIQNRINNKLIVEFPSGYIENNENPINAAKRELYEETGAIKTNIIPVATYKINSFSLLCYCEILKIEKIPKNSEISKIILSDKLPNNMTYQDTFKKFFELVNNKIIIKEE